MTYLNTQEVADLLKAAGTGVTTTEQVAEFARNEIFVGAFRDADGKGKWQIPSSEVSRFIGYSQGRKRKRRAKWFTVGFVGFLISVLGLLSVTKDTLDLAVSYIIPTATPAPCIFRAMPISDSGACRSLIPSHADQFRGQRWIIRKM
jgi:hypothetical protein